MAVTGAIMFGFVLGHMLGNLQAFLGREQLNHYAVLLRTVPELLWVVRAVLLISVILHIVASLQLKKTQMDARPIGYVKRKPVGSSFASRTMIWSGIVIALFIPYHLMHFTLGVPGIHPSFQELKPYENLVAGFRVIPVALFYVVAMILLSTAPVSRGVEHVPDTGRQQCEFQSQAPAVREGLRGSRDTRLHLASDCRDGRIAHLNVCNSIRKSPSGPIEKAWETSEV